MIHVNSVMRWTVEENKPHGEAFPDSTRDSRFRSAGLHRILRPVGIHIFKHDLDELLAELQRRGARVSQEIVRKFGETAISA